MFHFCCSISFKTRTGDREGKMACKPGFFGRSCNSPCPSGFFGKNCGGECFPNCSVNKCNRFNGCQKPKEHKQGPNQTSNPAIIPPINTSSSKEKEHSSDRIELNTTFTLYVLVGALCLFLFVILIQLYRKSKSKKVNVSDIENECYVQTQPENRHSYDTITESVNNVTVQTYRNLETEYDEIDEKAQLHNSSSPKTLSDNYEEPGISTGTSSPTHGAIDSRVPLKGLSD